MSNEAIWWWMQHAGLILAGVCVVLAVTIVVLDWRWNRRP